jgi:hypothetical protein
MSTVTKIDATRYRVEPVECPKCGSEHTRVADKVILFCYRCGEFSNPYDSPSVKRAMEEVEID